MSNISQYLVNAYKHNFICRLPYAPSVHIVLLAGQGPIDFSYSRGTCRLLHALALPPCAIVCDRYNVHIGFTSRGSTAGLAGVCAQPMRPLHILEGFRLPEGMFLSIPSGVYLWLGGLGAEAQPVRPLHILEGFCGAALAAPHTLPLCPTHATHHRGAKLLDRHRLVRRRVRRVRQPRHVFLQCARAGKFNMAGLEI